MWLVAVLVSTIVRIWGGGGFHGLVNLLVALVFVYDMPNLDFVFMLVPRIGGASGVGFRPFVVPPPSCRGGRFHTGSLLHAAS